MLKAYKNLQNVTLKLLLSYDNNKIGELEKHKDIIYYEDDDEDYFYCSYWASSPYKIDLGDSSEEDNIIAEDIRKLNLSNKRRKKREKFKDMFFTKSYRIRKYGNILYVNN